MSSPTLDIFGALRRVWGHQQFLPNQEVLVRAICGGRDAVAVMPTGSGKSLCYQLPAAVLEGTCVVISPLISLMKDQVDAARSNGLRAEFLNSSLSAENRDAVSERMLKNDLDLLYISPERFAKDGFVEFLNSARLSLFAVDEAHCISEWGHDFRPDYLGLSSIITHFPGVPTAAFTATATQQVQDDIVAKLGLRDPFTLRASFNRPNLRYAVVPKNDTDRQIFEFINSRPHEPGIVYRTTRDSVDTTAAGLAARGVNAAAYHAGKGPDERARVQDDFSKDNVQVIVATIAFGMGIDKSNVRFIIHADLPQNMERYYQETGRAGRDGEPADCLLLFGRGDIPRLRFFIEQISDDHERKIAQAKLNGMAGYARMNVCRRRQILAYFGETYAPDNCATCDVCTGNVEQVEATIDAQKVMSAIARTQERFGAVHITDIVCGARTEKIRRFGHDTLKTYGIGREYTKAYWRQVIDELIAQKCVTQTDDPYPALVLTAKGRGVLLGQTPFIMIRREKEEQLKSPIHTVDFDMGLFEHLRRLRKVIADEKGVPPFIVFSDRTLHDMCRRLPVDHAHMSRVSGVGQAKLREYGDAFIKAIQDYLAKNPHLTANQGTFEQPRLTAKPRKKGESMRETLALIHAGKSLAEISKARDVTVATIAAHIEALLIEGADIDLTRYMDAGKIERVQALFETLQTDRLGPLVEASQGDVNYEEARMVRGWMRKP